MMTFGDIYDLMREEALHPELVPHLREPTTMGEMVHSPLVISTLSMLPALRTLLSPATGTGLGSAAHGHDSIFEIQISYRYQCI